MYISCYLKTSLKIHEKKKNHFKKITASRQFPIREIGNFGTDQLRDRDEFHGVNYRRAGQRYLLR